MDVKRSRNGTVYRIVYIVFKYDVIFLESLLRWKGFDCRV